MQEIEIPQEGKDRHTNTTCEKRLTTCSAALRLWQHVVSTDNHFLYHFCLWWCGLISLNLTPITFYNTKEGVSQTVWCNDVSETQTFQFSVGKPQSNCHTKFRHTNSAYCPCAAVQQRIILYLFFLDISEGKIFVCLAEAHTAQEIKVWCNWNCGSCVRASWGKHHIYWLVSSMTLNVTLIEVILSFAVKWLSVSSSVLFCFYIVLHE